MRCKVQRKEEVTCKKENSAFFVHSAEVLENNVLILNKNKIISAFKKSVLFYNDNIKGTVLYFFVKNEKGTQLFAGE